jgi:sirohydrochlorin cobaltochelatase
MGRSTRFLEDCLAAGGFVIGQIEVLPGIVLRHTEDRGTDGLKVFNGAENSLEIAKYDAEGAYRPLKTAPNLARGWELRLGSVEELRLALDYFYPAAVGTWLAFERGELEAVPLRETLGRQTGMYRVTRLMNDEQADELNRTACDSESGCLRRVLWPLDAGRAVPLTEDAAAVRASVEGTREIPVLCAEACNLLVAAARPLGKANLPPKE